MLDEVNVLYTSVERPIQRLRLGAVLKKSNWFCKISFAKYSNAIK